MVERESWATQNSGPTGILDVEDTRVALGALWTPGASVVQSRSGFRPWAYAANFTFATGTPDGFVHVVAFQLILQTVRATAGGVYLCTSDAQKDINILSTPADPTNPRDDLIIARQTDTFYGDGSSVFAVERILGTPAAVPVDPTVTGSQDYVPLARVRVNALATTITQPNITDLRTSGHAKSLPAGLFTVAAGGLLPVASLTQRNAVAGLYDGLAVWRQDIDVIEVYNGTGFLTATPYRAAQTLGGTQASVTFSSIPSTLRKLRLFWSARSDPAVINDALRMRINGDSSGNYFMNESNTTNVTTANSTSAGGTSALVGHVLAASAGAGQFAVGSIDIIGWDAPHPKLNWRYGYYGYDTAANSFYGIGGGLFNVAGPYTSITLLPASGNFVSGSEFILEGSS